MTPTKLSVGDSIGHLQLLEYLPNYAGTPARWRVRCSCGVEKVLRNVDLEKARVQSCGHASVELRLETRKKTLDALKRAEEARWRSRQPMPKYE